jgi:hypothetical protein
MNEDDSHRTLPFADRLRIAAVDLAITGASEFTTLQRLGRLPAAPASKGVRGN